MGQGAGYDGVDAAVAKGVASRGHVRGGVSCAVDEFEYDFCLCAFSRVRCAGSRHGWLWSCFGRGWRGYGPGPERLSAAAGSRVSPGLSRSPANLLGMTTSTGGKQRADGTYEDEMPREKTEAPPAGRTAGNCNVSGQERKPPCPCITGPYDKIKDRCKAECGDGAQAHHIVPEDCSACKIARRGRGALLGYRPRTAPRRCQRSMQGRPYACRATRRTSKPNTTPRIATTSRFTPRAPRAPSREPYPWAVPWTCRSLKPRRPGRTVQPTSIVRSTPDSRGRQRHARPSDKDSAEGWKPGRSFPESATHYRALSDI